MRSSATPIRRLCPLALAAFLACGPALATTTVTSMQARGDFVLDAGTASESSGSLLQTYTAGVPSPTSLDVIRFPSNPATGSSAVLHSYGDLTGYFGSGSWGTGVFDVTGSFRIQLNITNDTSVAQNVVFNFNVTPGTLGVTPVDYGPNQFVETGIRFLVDKTQGSTTTSVFSSTGTLRSDANSAASFTSSGTNMYTDNGGTLVSIDGGNFSAGLGLLNPGDSVAVSYEISSFAKGDAIANGVLVPAQTITVPDQWVGFCGIAQTLVAVDVPLDVPGQVGEAVGGSDCFGTQFIPAHEITIPEHTTGDVGGAQGRSGDPFDVVFEPNDPSGLPVGTVVYRNFARLTAPNLAPPILVTFTPAVPEPGSYALMALGLLGLGLRARRRQAAA